MFHQLGRCSIVRGPDQPGSGLYIRWRGLQVGVVGTEQELADRHFVLIGYLGQRLQIFGLRDGGSPVAFNTLPMVCWFTVEDKVVLILCLALARRRWGQ